MQHLYDQILGNKNRTYYITKFEKFDQGPTGLHPSWNWPAFFFGGFWALYRKMYGWFFALLGVGLLTGIIEEVGLVGTGGLLYLMPGILFAIFGNSLYHKNIQKVIAKAQLKAKDDRSLAEHLQGMGGVNTWVMWLLLIPLLGILSAVLIPMLAGG